MERVGDFAHTHVKMTSESPRNQNARSFRYLRLPESEANTRVMSDCELRICAAQFKELVGAGEGIAALTRAFDPNSTKEAGGNTLGVKTLCAIKSKTTAILRWLIGSGPVSVPKDCCYMTSATAAKLGVSHGADVEVIFLKCFDDVDGMSDLDNLTELDLSGCSSLENLKILSGLNDLESLTLADCSTLKDIDGLSALARLQRLDMSGCSEVSDLSPISSLKNLRCLNLAKCADTLDLHPLSALSCLEELCLRAKPPYQGALERARQQGGHGKALYLRPIASLKRLTSLSLANRLALTDLAPLASLENLLHLDLMRCVSLSDLSPLSSLRALQSLNLYKCELLGDLSPLAALTELSSLYLQGCEKVTDLSPLSGCISLKELDCTGLPRITSLQGLSELHQLSKLEANFHPSVITEILSRAAWHRRDKEKIQAMASTWLDEASAAEEEKFANLLTLATTLASALSLLGRSAAGDELQTLLSRHPEFTSAPWKAWFGGTLKESGFDLYRCRVERVPLAEMTFGAIGGACLTLPLEEHLDWARQWLVELEKSRLGDAKTLLPVAPEICLAYSRSGDRQTLRRWLEAFTDPSDPATLDPVHAALAKFQIEGGDLAAAENHVHAIHSPAVRDPVLGEFVVHLAASDEDLASASLLLIEDQTLRSDLAKKLAAKSSASEILIHRCIVAAGESPQAIADLISALPQSARSDLVVQLSKKLQTDRKTMLLGIADELRRQADRLSAQALEVH